MKRLLLIGCSLFSLTVFSQKVFFTSSIEYNEYNLKNIHASVSMEDSLILFHSPNSMLYAYEKNTGAEKWTHLLYMTSNQPPFIVGKQLWADNGTRMQQLDIATGKWVKTMFFETIATQPFIKGNIAYFTGIYDGGNLIAYDMQRDSVIWKRFLAHGYSTRPLYLADRIIAYADGGRWLEIDYSGHLKDASCDTLQYDSPYELPCAKEFLGLAHDGNAIPFKLAEELSINEDYKTDIVTTAKHTFLLNNGRFTVLANKLKKKVHIELLSLADALQEHESEWQKILKADDTRVWMVYNQQLVIYNHNQKQLERVVDLSQWQPHQITMDKDKLWIVSGKDGQLYGVSI